MLLALLWPDPCDPNCPDEFKEKARQVLAPLPGKVGTTDEDLRKALLKFIGDFADWDRSTDPVYLETSRALVKAAHGDEPPLVVDSFAGGGSIPLEALRVGCETFASDLNPVACLILKVMLEDIPRHGQALADKLRRVGAEIKAVAEKELAEFYPVDTDGARPIAYLWARTVRCEAPNCGAEIPLMRSFWLCKKPNRKRALRYEVIRHNGKTPCVELDIFEPKTEMEVPSGTVTRAKATCLCCNTVLPPERVRAQLAEHKGGADAVFDENGNRIGGARLLAVVTIMPGLQGRQYRLSTEQDCAAIWKAHKSLNSKPLSGSPGLSSVPTERISLDEIRRISVPLYGASTWGDVFTARQKLVLSTYAETIRGAATSDVTRRILALAMDRIVMLCSAHCRWKPTGESVIDMFGRHAIGMVWDYCEPSPGFGNVNLFSSWLQQFDVFIDVLLGMALKPGDTAAADAVRLPLPDAACQVWFTDPPYYDSIPYSHLSDCFYVWLKRIFLPMSSDEIFRGDLTPKESECVVDRPHSVSKSTKDDKYFERKVSLAAAEGRRLLSDSGCASVVFAHKTTEGWEALLGGIIASGFTITGSWPIATELSSRLNARETASLATSVHLVLRPRPEDTPIGDWSEVLRELPKRVVDWMERLQQEGIRGADLVFACIGPALEIFSRYSKVETAEGMEVSLSQYLQKVWEVVARCALEQVLGTAEAQDRNQDAGALDEDARLTALFLWTLQGTNGESAGNGSGRGESEEEEMEEDDEEAVSRKKSKGYSLIFDVVRRLAQPLGINLSRWEGRIIETSKGVVRLLPVAERASQLVEPGVGRDLALIKSPETRSQMVQLDLFGEIQAQEHVSKNARQRVEKQTWSQLHLDSISTLDHVHKAMLFQKQGQTTALRELLFYEKHYRPDFVRLANAFSALYPRGSEEKRLVDAMLLALPK